MNAKVIKALKAMQPKPTNKQLQAHIKAKHERMIWSTARIAKR